MITKEILEKSAFSCIKYCNKEERIVFEENKTKYTAKNPNKKNILAFRVDNGYIKSTETKKCDFALIVEEDICYLIELKGKSVSVAAVQLLTTLELFLKQNPDMKRFLCRSIHTKISTHKIENENSKKLRKELIKLNKTFYSTTNSYLIKETNFVETI